MIIIKKISGDESTYTADEVITKQTEYIVVRKGIPIGQIPRERVDEIVFVQEAKPQS